MATDVQRLNAIAANYHKADSVPDMFIENICQEHSLAWITRMVSPPGRLLELGHGDGIITRGLLEQGHELHVVEGAEAIVADLQAAYGQRLTAVHSLFEDYQTDVLFDYVVATHVLEHVDDPVALVRRIRHWLKPAGKLLVIVPNRESIHRQLAVLMGLQPQLDTLSKRDELVGHQRVYSFAGLESDVRAGGFQIVERQGFFLKVLPNSMMLNYSHDLVRALNDVAAQVPAHLLANIGLVAQPGQ